MSDRKKTKTATESSPLSSTMTPVVSVAALGPPSGWVFCGADQYRNRLDHAAHCFCRCATDTKATVGRDRDCDRDREATPKVGGGGGDDDHAADASREKKETVCRPATSGRGGLPLAIECCVMTYLSQACHARAARTSTAMRLLCERREASPCVVTCRGVPNTNALDDASDLASSRDLYPNGYAAAPHVATFGRWSATVGTELAYATLDPAHPLFHQRRLSPRVLDLYRVRLRGDALERLLVAVASPKLEMLCVDATYIDRVATRVGRHAPGLLRLCLYETYAQDADVISRSDPYGDWSQLTRLTDLVLPATPDLASNFYEASKRRTNGGLDPLALPSPPPPPPVGLLRPWGCFARWPPPLPPTLTRLTLLPSVLWMTYVAGAMEFDCARLARFLPWLRDLTTPAAPTRSTMQSLRPDQFSRLVITREPGVTDADDNDGDGDDGEYDSDGNGEDGIDDQDTRKDGDDARGYGQGYVRGDYDRLQSSTVAAHQRQDALASVVLTAVDGAETLAPSGEPIRLRDTRAFVHVAEMDVVAADLDVSYLLPLRAIAPAALRSLVFRAGPSPSREPAPGVIGWRRLQVRRQLRHVVERFTALERLVLDGVHGAIDASTFDLVCRRLPRLAHLAFSGATRSDFDFRRTVALPVDELPPAAVVARDFFAPLGLLPRLRTLDFGAAHLPNPERSAPISAVADWNAVGSPVADWNVVGTPDSLPPPSRRPMSPSLPAFRPSPYWLPSLPLLLEYRAEQRTDLVRLLHVCPALTALRVSYSSFGYDSGGSAASATDVVARHLKLRTLALIAHPRWTSGRDAHDTVREIRERRRCAYVALMEREHNTRSAESPRGPLTLRKTDAGGERKADGGISHDSSTQSVKVARGLTIEVAWCHDPFRACDSGSICAGSSRLRLCVRGGGGGGGSVGEPGTTDALFSGDDNGRYSTTVLSSSSSPSSPSPSAAKSVLCVCCSLRKNARHCALPDRRSSSSSSSSLPPRLLSPVAVAAKKWANATYGAGFATQSSGTDAASAVTDDAASVGENDDGSAASLHPPAPSRTPTRSRLRLSGRTVALDIALVAAIFALAVAALSAVDTNISNSLVAVAFAFALAVVGFQVGRAIGDA